MSSSNPTQEDNEHRRKRVRKGTKSCWECKRRKIKCQLSTEDVPVCSGCLQRGTNCLSQEYPEEHDQPSNNQLGERMGRVELLLEKLLDKVNSYEKEKSIPTPESISNNDVLTPYSSTGNNVYENTPILSLFDNSVLGRKVKVVEPKPANKVVCGPPSKLERLRYTLTAQLPSQHDADIICDSAHCWLLIHALTQTYTSELFFSNGSVNSLNLAEAAKQHPTIIARTLLYLAVCMQQLPKTFDQTQLQLTSGIDATMEKYMANGTLITSDDELVSTTEGLECLVLQGVYHINAGNLRRAWLNFRRALNVGQLMGLNKGYTQSVNGDSLEKTIAGTRMWNQFVQGDRYLALLLGMPCGTGDLPENFAGSCSQNPELDADQVFNIKMFNISGRIIERNHEEFSHAFARTQEIDERLENLAKEMPQSWWDVPTVMLSDKSMDSARRFDRVMAQIWFFQLEALLHLPFMLRASKERRYEYSKFSCLRASRQMLDRYLTLRKEGPVSFCCKVMDFGAFTAAVTILLSLLDTSQGIINNIDDQQQRQADKLLIHTVVDSMKELSDTGDIVATQSVDAINTLLCALGDTSGQNSTNLRLSIPYFGTINIFRAVSSATNNTSLSVERQPLLPGENMVPQDIQTLPFASSLPSAPVVSFTSSQFPQFLPMQPIEDWNLQDSDTMFFDGLLNSDLEGNWYL